MKKYGLFAICMVLIILFAGCGNQAAPAVTIDYGNSSVYTKEDMDAAIATIQATFDTWEGCELHSLLYSSDGICTSEENIAWMNDLEKANDNEQVFTQCIMFDSSFHSPKKRAGAWNPDEEYEWTWWLARREGGEWKLMTFGAA